MAMMLTAATITDDQIRELGGPGCERSIRQLCKVALNDAPTYLKADVVRRARQRCADKINDRIRARCLGRDHRNHVTDVCEGTCCTACGGPIDDREECRC